MNKKFAPDLVRRLSENVDNWLTVAQAAISFGISRTTYYAWCKKSPEFNEYDQIRRTYAAAKVEQMIIDLATGQRPNGNAAAAIFLAKNLTEWKDKRDVNIFDGGKMTLEQFSARLNE